MPLDLAISVCNPLKSPRNGLLSSSVPSTTCNIAWHWLTARTFPRLLWQTLLASTASNIFKTCCALSSSHLHNPNPDKPEANREREEGKLRNKAGPKAPYT